MKWVGKVAGKVISKSAKYVWEKAEKVGLIDWFRNIKQMFPSMSDQGILLKAKDVLKEVRGEKGVLKESEEVLKRTGIKTQPTFASKIRNLSCEGTRTVNVRRKCRISSDVRGRRCSNK